MKTLTARVFGGEVFGWNIFRGSLSLIYGLSFGLFDQRPPQYISSLEIRAW